MEKEDKTLDRKALMENYSDSILSKGKRPANVYIFAKEHKIEESDFYRYFSGFEALEKEYLIYFFDQSLKLTEKIDNYQELPGKEKILNFYYLFFENLNMNRSLILMLFDTNLKSKLRKLKYLRHRHQDFVHSLHLKDWEILEKAPEKLNIIKDKSKEEVLWLHFLSILNFWKNDQSAGFEKTDIYIEKSISTGFDMVQSPLIDKFIDLGKFFCQEKWN